MKLGYLSAAPRVSTKPNVGLAGPRSHVLGVIHAFEELGWDVARFIVGDRVPESVASPARNNPRRKPGIAAFATDFARLALAEVNGQRAVRELGGRVDCVYERFAALQALGQRFKRRGVPWILETNAPLFHEASVERKTLALSKLARAREERAYRECDALVCVTETLREIIADEFHLSRDKMVVVPNGVDTRIFDPNLYRGHRHFKQFTIGYIGGLDTWQGLDLLLRAAAELREGQRDIAIAIAGDGPLRTELQQMAREIGLGDAIRFFGYTPWDRVPEFLAGVDVCYSGQTKRPIGTMYGSPLKLYEYLAMGKPVIISAFEDARRTIVENETGFLFEGGDEAGLRAAIGRAWERRAGIGTMGIAARREAEEKHSWTVRVRTMLEQLNGVIPNQR